MADKRNNIIRDQKPGSRKLVHSPVATVTPPFYQSEYPKLVAFLEKYFEYIQDTDGFGDFITKLQDIRNVDVTESTYAEILFDNEFGSAFPELASIDETVAIRLFEYWYKSKGTKEAVEAYFRIFLNTNVEVAYPKDEMLIVDGGNWDDDLGDYTDNDSKLDETTARIQDDWFYQAYSYLVTAGQSISDWGDTFNKAAHPAGFNVFGKVELSGTTGVFNNIATRSPTIVPGFQTLDAEILLLGSAAHAMGVSPQVITKTFINLLGKGLVDEHSFVDVRRNILSSTYAIYDLHEVAISDFETSDANQLRRPARVDLLPLWAKVYNMLSNQTAAALFNIDDTSSLRVGRDGSGGVPVDGDSVGMMMDVSGTGGSTMAAHLAGATELVTNGTFDTDSDWSKGTNASISGGVATINVVGGAFTYIFQPISFTEGAWYVVTLTLNGDAGNNVRVKDFTDGTGALQFPANDVTLTGSNQQVEYIFQANANSNQIQIARSDLGDWSFTVDNISVKALPGYAATAPSDAARPTLREDVGSGKYYLDFDGTDDNLILDGTDFGSSTNAALYKTFRGDTADTSHIMFASSGPAYILAGQSGDTATALSGSVGSPVYREDGVIPAYANRDDIFTALIDNTDHTIGVEEVNLSGSASWASDGFYIGGEFSTLWDSTGRLYAWAVVANSLDEYERDLLENFMLSKKTT